MAIFLFANIWHTVTIVRILCLHHSQSAFSLDLLSVCNSRMPTGTKSIHSPQLFLTYSLVGFSTHTNTHDTQRASISTLRYFTPVRQHLHRTGKVNEQKWFVCKCGTEGTMRFAVKFFFFVTSAGSERTRPIPTDRLPPGPLHLLHHNYQQQMTEQGGVASRLSSSVRSHITEKEKERRLAGG